MWSALTKDFGELAANFRKDSIGFVDLLGKIAADVVGEGGVYAGDEVTAEAKEMPLDNDVLLEFQESDDTYCRPLSKEEQELFPAWEAASPFSNVNVQKRIAAAAARAEARATVEANPSDIPDTEADTGRQGQAPPASPSSPSKSSTWPDEPADESRQRLLDYSEAVLAKYTTLVGEAVSPRATPQGSPVRPNSGGASLGTSATGKDPNGSEAATPAKQSSPFVGTPSAASTTRGGATPSSPKGSGGRLSEDEFFDRYFFRLAQLRAYCAEQRREEEAVQAQARAATTTTTASVEATPASTAPAREALSPGGAEDDNPVPAFARKLMAAANDFVTNIDVALTGTGSTPARDADSDADNVTPPHTAEDLKGFARRRVPAAEAAALEQRAAALESVVQELQEELRKERARVQQLTGLLEAHKVPVPPYPPRSSSASPIKPAGAETLDKDKKVNTSGVQSMKSAESASSGTSSKHVDPSALEEAAAPASDELPSTRHTSSANVDDGWEKISDQ